MKKILGILVIAGSLVACNDNAASTENKKDSIDSAAKAKTDALDSAANAKTDAIDSAAKAKKDSLDKADSASHK
jgi:hypothetical protein